MSPTTTEDPRHEAAPARSAGDAPSAPRASERAPARAPASLPEQPIPAPPKKTWSPTPAARARRGALDAPWLRVLAGLLALLVVLAALPNDLIPRRPGLDPSYGDALAELAAGGAVHGRDVVFPYGPLGHLLLPRDVGAQLPWAIALSLLLAASVGGALALAAWRGRALAALGGALLVHLGAACGLGKAGWLSLAVLFLAALSLEEGRARLPLALLAGALASFALFAKLSSGVAALGVVALVELIRALDPRLRDLRAHLAALLGAGGVFLAVLVVHFGGAAHFGAWLEGSLELVRGYAAAMSLPAPPALLGAGAGLLALGALAALLVFREGGGARGALVALPLLLLAFPHGFVRGDDHLFGFFATALAAAGALLALAREKAGVGAAIVFALAALAGAGYALEERGRGAEALLARADAPAARASLGALADLDAAREELALRSALNFEGRRLPAEWVEGLLERGARVDAYPDDIATILEAGLAWAPHPNLQDYTTYTAALDEEAAAHYADEARAPDFLVASWKGVDGRHPTFTAPRSFVEILRRYEPIGAQADPPRLLLSRTQAPRFGEGRRLRVAVEAEVGTWVDLPRAEGLLLAEIEWEPTLAGRLRGKATGIPAALVEVMREDGTREIYRFLPATAGAGLPIDRLPDDVRSWARLLAGEEIPRVVAFRIGGPAESHHAARFSARIVELDFVPEAPGGS